MKDTIKYIILEQLITEGRVEDAKTKYPCLPPKLVDYFSQNDPSGNNKYLDWMCKQIWDENHDVGSLGDYGDTISYWLKEEGSQSNDDCEEYWVDHVNNNFSDLDDDVESIDDIPVTSWIKGMADIILEEVVLFHKFVNGLKEKDINKYDYNDLVDALASKKLKAVEKSLAKDVNKIFENNEWLIISPKTHQASCVYGANTKWCVTNRDSPNYFKSYTENENYLIFVINKINNKKWAINTDAKTNSKNVEINLPWHREISLINGEKRYSDRQHNKKVEAYFKSIYNDITTTYYNAVDDEISWDEFIDESELPKDLVKLLMFVEKKIKINFARKKKTDVAYEVNENPNKLRKGDKVKLLASGFGYIRGDEGYVIGPSLERNPNLYYVYVPNRKIYGGTRDSIYIEQGDILTTKLDLSSGQWLVGLLINNKYLQKI